MRLIDVDNVNIPIMQRKGDAWVFKCNFKEVLNTLPTVEAIPIEWVEKRMREINEAMTRLYVEGCFYPKSDDDYEERKNILLRRLAEIKLHGSAYELVLNEWRVEKENEIDRRR